MSTVSQRAQQAIEAFRHGRMVIMVDDEDRENEGDLCLAAESVTPEAINFMAKHGRGLICLSMDEVQIDKLSLPMMVRENRAALETAFTVSIEARHGVTTGISARDRATTIRAAIADNAKPEDLVSPGHVFPLRARRGGVLVRTGQTEGSVDLARLAGRKPAAVICEIMRDDGEMARMPDLELFAAEHKIPIVTIADLVAFRLGQERIVQRKQTRWFRPGVLDEGEPFAAHYYRSDVEETEYLALVRGDVGAAAKQGQPVLVRVQSMCPVRDPFGLRPQLNAALQSIDDAGVGVFLYVYNGERTSMARALEESNIGGESATEPLPTKTSSKVAENERTTSHSQALRDFGLGAQVLADLGCRDIVLMSNSDRRIVGIEGFGIHVVNRIPIPVKPGPVRLRPIDGGKR